MSNSETLDQLMPGNLQLWQAKEGHRYSIDAVLLARFVRLGTCRQLADLGTGNAVLPLLLASLTGDAHICGFELQQEMVARARRNVELNGLAERISICATDIRNIRDIWEPGAMDLVVSNPPYRAPISGRVAPNDERAHARHELAGTIDDFALAAAWLLKNGGRFAVVYLVERLNQLFIAMTRAGLEPKRLRMIHATAHSAARLVLVEGIKGGRPGLQVEKPLVLYESCQAERRYTEEVEQMYGNDGAEGQRSCFL
ncbi:tRNA1(Val) (adenine(37)-N6)-methyltransferase [Pelovirga terrestris]|uniref:tRNA1(Val) (Adenine(37)-N6)-methyltransferase n=1 Tax=Pelovirga terrestris TaxID=2771352 RepID=A0A8J6QXC9_9BACT|nr:tRNA1(Val) (adenine(37)-N6)-methyltransferase [Pelovirga terrestris]MBD1400167.1 tRNA1(Val) (adenine(37)-N6)-methyltransferase [Pelovirga terrestris]